MANLIHPDPLPRILLVEPDGLVRGTVAAVCRDLSLGDVVQAVSCESAIKALADESLRGCIVSMTQNEAALTLLSRLREGQFTCPADMPVVMTAAGVDGATAVRLKELRIRRLLLKPFKIRDLVNTVENLLAVSTEAG